MYRTVIAFLLALTTLGAVPADVAAQGRGFGIGSNRAEYDRGYRDGLRDGERDARQGRAFDYDNDRQLSRRGDNFRRGYIEGYRAGYAQIRGIGRTRNNRSSGGYYGGDRARRGGYQDPAFARGYSDGFERGLDDGRDRDRYDPVRHRDYRNADDGYYRDYGPKQAYENNYRAGFRQGYEEGYRNGNRRR
jgi:flagellar biosynthesis/type III secretory pathway protein FliH